MFEVNAAEQKLTAFSLKAEVTVASVFRMLLTSPEKKKSAVADFPLPVQVILEASEHRTAFKNQIEANTEQRQKQWGQSCCVQQATTKKQEKYICFHEQIVVIIL